MNIKVTATVHKRVTKRVHKSQQRKSKYTIN